MKKKMGMLFLSLLTMFLVTGCGTAEEKEQKLVCTTTENDDEMRVEQVISMTYKKDQLKRMTMEVNTTITDSTIQANWEEFKKAMDETNNEFSKDGISSKINVNDQNYEYSIILDIDLEKASEEDLIEQGLDGLKDDKSTLEESKEAAEKDGAICVIK